MIVQGHLILDAEQAPTPGWLRIEQERIDEVHEGDLPDGYRADLGGPQVIITPGFIDAHTHLPQFGCIGYDGLPLLDWLDRVVYPAEMHWSDAEFAARDAEAALTRMLKSGTLACAAFLTSHRHSLKAGERANQRIPIRLRAGRVLMDQNAPSELIPSPADFENSHAPIEGIEETINPRFAVACSDKLLAIAGRRSAADRSRWVHTHLAENHAECAAVKALFPDDANYTVVYDRHGLLHERTLLAHAIHLSDDEWGLIQQRGSVVVHCPTANVFLGSGSFKLDAAREHGVKVALGSDIGAGTDVAMPRVARAMIETAKSRRMTIAPNAYVPSPGEAWRVITQGNADALGWRDLGRIGKGATANLLVLRPSNQISADEHTVARLIYEWDQSFIDSAILGGAVYRMSTR